MSRLTLSLAVLAIGTLLAGDIASAQLPVPGGPDKKAATAERAAAKKKAAEDRAMKKQKEEGCKKQADEQKLRLLKRRSFVKECVAKG
ncbi:MAG: hypothetical protein M3R18_01850 [Pseudomonadota bacterium]|nr:hypothetical protein [Pseudomonadota bacterium]